MNGVVLVTGASSGMGNVTCRLLAKAGYTVYAGARRVESMADLKPLGITPLFLDVTDETSLVEAVGRIENETGAIDVLVNNAGLGVHGAVEDVSLDRARYQMEVNVFGAMRLIQLVLPGMRKRRSGKIVNLSSVGGKLAGPMAGWYHASKFALEALSDSLRMELRSWGVQVIVVEPGAIRSEWGDIARRNLIQASGSGPYRPLAEAYGRLIQRSEERSTDPAVIGRLIVSALAARTPRSRYAKGHLARTTLLIRALCSDGALDRLLLSQIQ